MCCPNYWENEQIRDKISLFTLFKSQILEKTNFIFFKNSRSRPTLSRHAKVLAIRRILTITKKSLFASHPPKNARKNSRTFKNPFVKKSQKKRSRTYNSVNKWNSLKNPLVAVQKTIFGYECKQKANEKISSSSPLMWDWMFNVFLWFNTGHIMQFELLRYIEQLMQVSMLFSSTTQKSTFICQIICRIFVN